MYCNDSGNSMITILDCGHEHILHPDVEPKDFKCLTRVATTLPCGHKTTGKFCHIDVKDWKCDLPCDIRIEPCGHSCVRACHVNHDPDHIAYKCYKTCDRVLNNCSTKTHICQQYCYQECGSCTVVMMKKLPNCNHLHELKCSDSGEEIMCEESCTKKIEKCGHDCKLKCYEPCGGCDELVNKTIPSCGHEILIKCTETPQTKDCHGLCPKLLPCGHPCKKKCNQVCINLYCRELVDHRKAVFCRHKFKIECNLRTKELPSYSSSLLQFCKEPCAEVLDCSHKCSGTCGECAQGRIHKTCMEKCGVDLICGHECKIPCREVCQPCQMKCGLRCIHNKCNKKCGDVCTECKERCTRQCEHVKCRSKCGEICTVPPCKEPCQKRLLCSHPCVGFCGDPCPPLCRICNKDELTEVFLGYEDEIDARFVLLDECKHVIESKAMEIYCEQDEGGHKGIKYIRCPKCRTPITSTQRYSDYVKKAIKDVAAIKKKSSGSYPEIQEKHKELQKKLDAIKELQQTRVFLTSEGIDEFVNKCDSLLQPVYKNRRQMFDLMIGKTLEAKLTIVQNMGNILKAQKLNVPLGSTSTSSASVVLSEASIYVDYLFHRLTYQINRITNQEIQDFTREQDRLQRIAQFVKIAESSPHGDHREIRKLIYRPIIFSKDYDKNVKAKLEEFLKKMRLVGGLTDQERVEIKRAVGLQKGNWYKCPNGHIYAIGECGAAVQVGKCYECKVGIGGTNHRLLPGNSYAGEMDGSRYAAWSNTANNMLNFELNDFDL